MQKSSAKTAVDDSTRRLTRRLIEQGGVTLQRFKWTPAPGNPYTGDQRLLELSLELLLEFYTPGRLENLLTTLWMGNTKAFLIFGNTILSNSEFSDKVRQELLELNKTSAVDMRHSCLRLAPESVGSSGRRDKDVSDAIQICSGLVIGSKQVSLGIVYRDIDDRNAELSPRLRWMARQIQQDQTALLPLIRNHNRQPNVARALVNSQTGELIWNNALARVGWTDKSKLIDLLIRPEVPIGHEPAPGAEVDLTLITFLRAAQIDEVDLESLRNTQETVSNAHPNDTAVDTKSGIETMYPTPEFSLPEPIKRRLKKVIFQTPRTIKSAGRHSDLTSSAPKKTGTTREPRQDD